MKENAKFRSDAGLKCFINRTTDGKCCEWCSALAGRYVYGEHPDDIFRRHDNCGCSTIFENGRQRQDVWSKKSWEAPAVTQRDTTPTRLSTEQAREIQGRNLRFRGIKNTTSSQNRKLVVYDGTEKTITRGEKLIVLRHMDGTSTNMYISARCKLKPKERHNIDVRIREAMEMLGISNLDNLPAIHVLTNAEIQKNAIASYNAVTNVITVDETFGKSLEKIITLQKDCASKDNKLSTIIHELFHWSDAQEYQKHFGKITDANYEKYIEHLNKKREKTIDKLGINEYNVGEISDYAKQNYERHNYDEVFTEYRVQEILR